jgi:hypothetical protein
VRFAPPFVLVVVTLLDLHYGRFGWSWVAGPVAALAVYGFDRASRKPAPPAPAHHRVPAPVD